MKPKPDEHDLALFREATRGVKPLRHAPRVSRDAPAPPLRARLAQAGRTLLLDETVHDPVDVPEPAPADASVFARPGVATATLRKLRRGQYRLEAQLDLHGLTAADAKVQLRAFLIDCLQRHVRCLRIVHGKGLRSGPRGPVLRLLVNSTLRRTARVLAFASARQADGGTGAVYVLLDAAHTSSASSTTD